MEKGKLQGCAPHPLFPPTSILRPGALCSHPLACFLPERGQPLSTHRWSLSFLSLGFSSKEELNPKPLESTSQGNPSRYFRINFIIKHYHFINYTLLECIQIKKQKVSFQESLRNSWNAFFPCRATGSILR